MAKNGVDKDDDKPIKTLSEEDIRCISLFALVYCYQLHGSAGA
mgnify:CR=1 FL=1